MKIQNMYNKMMDMTNIFGLFSNSDELDGSDSSKTLIGFKETPIYHVGMYKKLIANHMNFNTKILQFFKSTNQDFDIKDVEKVLYFESFLVIEPGLTKLKKNQLISEEECTKAQEEYKTTDHSRYMPK